MASTLSIVRSGLRPYSVSRGGPFEDTQVKSIMQDFAPESLPALMAYSRSIYSDEAHLASFLKFARPLDTATAIEAKLSSDPYIQEALTIVSQQVAPYLTVNAIPLNQLDLVRYESSTSAGYGYIGNKSDNYLLARNHATRRYFDWLDKRFTYYEHTPCLAFVRTQLSPVIEPKVRHVFGSPFHQILLEGTVACPILDKIIGSACPWYIGHVIYKELTSDFLRQYSQEDFIYAIDFSGFDQSINPFFIKQFFNLLKKHVTFERTQDELVLDFCQEYLLNCPVLMPNGDLYIMRHGLASGSYFTQLIGSFTNHVLQTAFHLAHRSRIAAQLYLGDDSLVTSTTSFTVEDFSNYFESFGFKVNLTKSIFTRSLSEVYFLGHNFKGSRLSRDDFTIACLLLHTERGSPTVEESMIRVLSLLVDSSYSSHLPQQLSEIIRTRWNPQVPASFGVAPYYYGIFKLT